MRASMTAWMIQKARERCWLLQMVDNSHVLGTETPKSRFVMKLVLVVVTSRENVWRKQHRPSFSWAEGAPNQL